MNFTASYTFLDISFYESVKAFLSSVDCYFWCNVSDNQYTILSNSPFVMDLIEDYCSSNNINYLMEFYL